MGSYDKGTEDLCAGGGYENSDEVGGNRIPAVEP